MPDSGTTPKLVFSPNRPQACAGQRIEPPRSEPSSKALKPQATATAAPPEEPPGERSRSHGLEVRPKIGLLATKSPE